uniref:Netrin receptor UNC5 n=1 Tax=Saccoglossus kowalevskii TaxID=10224 RepID=A0ABM0MBX4_SACKO|nr:PREDICTED: netrin receptor UNC5C-like [Saccoglossus kowalevskii]
MGNCSSKRIQPHDSELSCIHSNLDSPGSRKSSFKFKSLLIRREKEEWNCEDGDTSTIAATEDGTDEEGAASSEGVAVSSEEGAVSPSSSNYASGNSPERQQAKDRFDASGGHLIINSTGVSLFIPPNAIDDGRTEEITLTITHKTCYQPQLSEKESVISPVIICGPPGLKFNKQVVLTYPHCVSLRGDKWQMKPLICDTAPDVPTHYDDLRDDANALCFFDEQRCTILVDHFTGYTTSGEPTTCGGSSEPIKIMNIMVFSSLEEDGILKLRIHVINKTDDAIQNVIEEERTMKGKLTHGNKPLLLKTNRKSVQVKIGNIIPVWHVYPDYIQVLSYSNMFQGGGEKCTFIISKDKDAQSDETRFDCVIEMGQVDNQPEENITLVISEAIQCRPIQDKDSLERAVFATSSKTTAAFKFSEVKQLEALDIENDVGTDWRLFAEKILNLTFAEISQIQHKSKSPMSTLISIWESRHINPSMDDFAQLHKFFSDNQMGVAGVIMDHVREHFGVDACDSLLAGIAPSQAAIDQSFRISADVRRRNKAVGFKLKGDVQSISTGDSGFTSSALN